MTLIRLWSGFFACLLLVSSLLVPAPMAHAATDWAIPGGHFYTQTNGGAGELGYGVVDDAQARFWSEFRRLGGVNAVGYPVSHRFMWDGFVVQAFQKAVFQWRPEVGQAYFVNVFDQLSAAGKDEWLEAARATPPSFDHSADAGLPWEGVVRRHLAILDANPPIRAMYNAAHDPIQMYGLPMSSKDYGNVFVVRAQRAVFQQWKQDVPWARAGQVVVANGGDVAKEAGMYPAAATQPAAATNLPGTADAAPSQPTQPAPATGTQWKVHEDGEKRFQVPATWEGFAAGASNFYIEPEEGEALILYMAPFGMGSGYRLDDFLTEVTHYLAGGRDIVITHREQRTINGYPADLAMFETRGQNPVRGAYVTYQRGRWVHVIAVATLASRWATYEPIFNEVINSYVPKAD